MPNKLSQLEYISVLNSYEADAVQNNQTYTKDSEELMRRYKRELYGNEKPERSKIVSNDVQDLVDSDMPALVRMFLGANKVCTFKPSSENPDDIEEAKQKTEYIDWIVRRQGDSFATQHSFLKDVDSQKLGALKWLMEDVVEKREESFEDHSAEEIAQIMEDLETDEVKSVEIKTRGEINEETQRFDATIEVITETRKAKVIAVPIESLLISSNTADEESANLIGDRITKTRGQLVKEGYSAKLVDGLKLAPSESNRTLAQIRFNDQGGFADGQDTLAWSNVKIEISDLYVMVDKDGDGIPQRRHVLKSGDTILDDEPFPMVPYAITSAILMSHAIVGMSRAELVLDTAEIQTALKRGIADNTYSFNAPQIGVNDNVNFDDLLTKRPNGIVRTKGDNNPGQSIFPFNVDYIGDRSLQVVQHFDNERARTTGDFIASQGLSADTFEKETATRFNGIKERGAEKIELVARVIAENAYCRLYNGLAWYVSQYQTTDQEIMVLGKPLKVNPKNWRYQHKATSCIGLGAGDGDKQLETLTGIFQLQSQLKMEGSPLVDEAKRYQTIDAIMKASDIHDTSQYFNNPEMPQQQLQFQNEQLKAMVQQMQQAIEQLQAKNPLAEAEQVKAQSSLQAKIIDLQSKAVKDASELEEKKRQFNISTIQQAKEHDDDLALSLTELEVESGQDIPGSAV